MATWKCPGCGEALSAPDSSVALRLRCTQCGQIFQTEPTPAPEGSGPAEPEPSRSAALPKSAIAILAFCFCAVVAVVLYAFVFSGPAVVVPDEAALSSKPTTAGTSGQADRGTGPGADVAAAPTGGLTGPADPPRIGLTNPDPETPDPVETSTTGPPTWPPVEPAPPKPAKPTEPEKQPPATPPVKPAKPTKPAKPAEPPKPKVDPDKPTTSDDPLVRIVSALYVGKVEAAGAQLDAMKDAQKSNPLYQLVLGQRYTRASDNAKATGAYRAAVGLDPQLPDAYLYLGASYAIGGRVPQALEQLKVGKGLLPKDTRFTYAEALAHFRARDWEKSRAAFESVAAKGGPLAPIAKDRAGRVAGVKSALDQIATKKATLNQSTQEVQGKLKDARAKLSQAEAKKEAMRKSYNSERSGIARRYSERVRRANREYDRTVNTYRRYDNDNRDSDRYRRRRDAARRRDDELNRARRERDSSYAKLEGKYKPKVSPLNVEINQQKKEVAKHMQAQAQARREATKLRAEEAAQLAPPRISIADDVRTMLPLKPSRMRELVQARKSTKAVAKP